MLLSLGVAPNLRRRQIYSGSLAKSSGVLPLQLGSQRPYSRRQAIIAATVSLSDNQPVVLRSNHNNYYSEMETYFHTIHKPTSCRITPHFGDIQTRFVAASEVTDNYRNPPACAAKLFPPAPSCE